MKVAFFTDTYYPQINGVTISLANFAKELRSRGNTVYIFAPRINGYVDKDPQVFRLPSVKILSSEPEVRIPVVFPHEILREILPVQFDIVHAHGNGAFSFLGYQIARMKGVPYVLTFHTQQTKYTHYVFNGRVVKPRMVAAGLRIFGNLCDAIVTPSEKMKDELQKYGVKKPIHIIPNFVNVSGFENIKKGYLHVHYNIPNDAPILLSVGRLGKEKNFAFVIRMFNKLTKRDKRTHLAIVGHGVEKENLEKLADVLGISERVHFTDRIDNEAMPQVYADADLFVFASKSEVHPMVILEAAASGLPFVIVNDKAFKHIVEDNVNGYSLPLNQSLFVRKIRLLLKNDEKRQAFGRASKRLIRTQCNVENIVNNLLQLYTETITSSSHSSIKPLTRLNKAASITVQQASNLLEKLFST